jgi:hypothetical protein
MAQSLSVKLFFTSPKGLLARQDLEDMMNSEEFNTSSTYSPSSTERILFVDKHLDYLSKHPQVNPNHYLSNLKLMTRIRN